MRKESSTQTCRPRPESMCSWRGMDKCGFWYLVGYIMLTQNSPTSPSISTLRFRMAEFIEPGEFLAGTEKYPQQSIHALVQPFNNYENQLRERFASEAGTIPNFEPAVCSFLINIFTLGNPPKIKCRRSLGDPQKYICPLQNPKPDGAESIVPSLEVFQSNFNAFTNSAFDSFSKSDWSNIVIAGGSVTMCLQQNG